jgi:ATP-dependent Clp protease ATP-binding subunit ClpC
VDLYKLSPKAKQALAVAKKEAQLLRNKYAGTEHLLLGLLNIGDSIITDILLDYSVDIDELRNIVYDNISQEGDEDVATEDIAFTPRVEKVLELSNTIALKLGRDKIDIEHIFLGLLYETDGVANNILQSLGISFQKVKSQVNDEVGGPLDEVDTQFVRNDEEIIKLKNVQKYGIDLTRLASKKKIDPIIGRNKEITRLIQVLCRKTKNNPVLVGDAGVGKTAVVEGLARRIVEGNVPEILANKHIISVDLTSLVAGTKYRGQFEERIKGLLRDVQKNKNIIMFIDEIHMMVGAGSAEGTMDASNILKPALARGELKCIGATTPDEFRKTIEKDSALERRFQLINVGEPTRDESVNILKGIRSSYEKFHNVKYTDDSLIAAVKLSQRYIPDRNLPDKAIDIIDEAGARNHTTNEQTTKIRELKESIDRSKKKKESLVAGQQFEEASKYRDKEKEATEMYEEILTEYRNRKKNAVTVEVQDIESIVSQMTDIPVTANNDDDKTKVLQLHKILQKKIVGQEDAVFTICDALKRSFAKLQDPKKPVGSFLFLGPTGVGKTYLAKVLASELFGSERKLIQIDMSELMDQHSSSKLVGSPPGYIGYDEGGSLTEMVKKNPYSLVLFDEIEKAHPDVLNNLLQILEEGKITDSTGREINFKNTIVVMTSNIGAEKIMSPLPMGFKTPTDEERQQMKSDNALDEAKSHFRPEFLNRIDDVVSFDSLSRESISQIIDISFKEYQDRIADNYNISVELHKTAHDIILDKGYDEKYGAREIKRTIKKVFETNIADYLLKGKFKEGDTIVCYANKQSEIKFRKKTTREKNQRP